VRDARGLRERIAASLGAPAELFAVLDEVFAELDSLGSMPRRLVRMMGAGRARRAVDLACGKGTAAVALARAGWRVLGVDAYGPFVEDAQERARRARVAARCRFRVGYVERVGGRFDAALMLGLFPLARAAPLLRRLVRPGGLYVIDDVFVDTVHRDAWRGIPTRAECGAFIESLGDRVVKVDVPTRAEVRRLNRRIYERAARGARRMARSRPELRPALRELLRRQRRANEDLGGPLRPAIWLVKRGGRRLA
jgi:SAM-dependent methyltransferase